MRRPYNTSMPRVYLDNNATTQPTPEVVRAVEQSLRRAWANPSSVHRPGQEARHGLELARAALASLIHAQERELLLTSGGTESNNLALRGVLHKGGTLLTTKVEHSAIREPAQHLPAGATVRTIAVDRQGVVELDDLSRQLRDETLPAPLLLSVQWANNETGVLQPVREIATLLRGQSRRVLFHTDATQAVGKIPVDVKQIAVDLLTFAPHKFHGPKGVGCLYIRPGVRLQPQQRGGPQERDRRGGTENAPGIVGAGVAAEQAAAFLQDAPALARLTAMRDRLEHGLTRACPGAAINSASAPRLWNTTNIAFPRLEAEAILLGLSERGLCASAGAACSSGSLEPSPVLLAMGVPEALAHGSIRLSLSRFTTDRDIDHALAIVPEVVRRLARTLPQPTDDPIVLA